MLERLVSPVPNVATFIALCVVPLGAVLRVRRRSTLSRILQLIGSCVIVGSTVVTLYAETILRPLKLGMQVAPERKDLAVALWFAATIGLTVGFVCFAWGYVTEDAD